MPEAESVSTQDCDVEFEGSVDAVIDRGAVAVKDPLPVPLADAETVTVALGDLDLVAEPLSDFAAE